jgi:hypothetical protein
MLGAYALRFLYSIGYGYYKFIICEYTWRMLINGIMWFLMQVIAIVPMLCLHRESFSEK